MPVDVLAIGAHADDVELCLRRHARALTARGRRFGIVDLTRGEMGTRGDAATRGREAERAAEILGADFREMLDFGDGGLAQDPRQRARADRSSSAARSRASS